MLIHVGIRFILRKVPMRVAQMRMTAHGSLPRGVMGHHSHGGSPRAAGGACLRTLSTLR
jgi:hypothetical protein